MKINSNNRTIVNILGAPLIIFLIINSQFSFYFLISFIIFISFYEYITLIVKKTNLTISNFILGFLWISSIVCFIPIYKKFNYGFVLVIFFAIWITDSAAFIMGKKFGKKKILPSISPNKTWVGSISGLLFSMLFVLIIFCNSHYFLFYEGHVWKQFTLFDILMFGFITGFFSQIGDFLESSFKRGLDVKDSSKLLLGHGGFLDRFDSFFSVGIAMYVYILLCSF